MKHIAWVNDVKSCFLLLSNTSGRNKYLFLRSEDRFVGCQPPILLQETLS